MDFRLVIYFFFHYTCIFCFTQQLYFSYFQDHKEEARGQKFVKILLEIKRDFDEISNFFGRYSFSKETLSASIINDCAQVSK